MKRKNQVQKKVKVDPVTKIVSVALRIIKKTFPKLKLIISYADTAQGHEGKIYYAGNWIYAGMGGGNSIITRKKDKKVVHERGVRIYIKAGLAKKSDFEWTEAKPKHKFLWFFDKELRKKICGTSKENVAPNSPVGRGRCDSDRVAPKKDGKIKRHA